MWILISPYDENLGRLLLGKHNSRARISFPTDHLRPLQREVIVAALDGHDVFVQAATSFGKSLCFQLPAVIDHGSKFPLLSNNIHSELFQLQSSSHHCFH